MSLMGVACAGFSNNFPILATGFVIEFVFDTKCILVDFGKQLTVSADCYALVFGMYNLYVKYLSTKGTM